MRALRLVVPVLLLACSGRSDVGDGAAGKGGASPETGGTGGTGGQSGSSGASGQSGGSGTSGKGGSSGSSGGTSGSSGSAAGGTSGSSGMSGAGGSVGGSATGGSSGASGSSGDGGAAGTDMACCLASPTCGPDQTEVASLDDCPPGSTCRELTICCSTIVCASRSFECDGLPACDEGDTEVTDCLEEESCYERSGCDVTILCREETCDPEAEYNRDYVELGPQCSLMNVLCPAQTEYFRNDCGCGCEQSSDCPAFANCQPGPETNPFCTSNGMSQCPYTEYVY